MSNRTLSFLAAALVFMGTSLQTQYVSAQGPIQGDWKFDIVKFAGASEPFLPPGNVFSFNEASAITGQNMPQVGFPLCAMTGERSGLVFMGTETCGIPRNSFGAFLGVLDSTRRPTTLKMFWADSKGVYLILGSKLP